MVLQAACKEYRHPEEQLLGLVGADFELIDLIKVHPVDARRPELANNAIAETSCSSR